MSTGSGILHSERNASDEEPVSFLQICIVPGRRSIEPSYEQRALPRAVEGEARPTSSIGAELLISDLA